MIMVMKMKMTDDPDEGHECYLTRTYITYFKRTSTAYGYEGIWEENSPDGIKKFIEINEKKVRIRGNTYD